ncbi:putative GTP-binding protein 6 isoform X1 [Poeciliopsis prolifica]|uniref:putative GTP-binding protein 6 isoform X1 n=1 Tax=Poeciliopsis prolifica TaxID=188132 RepID=UPI002413682E|nr:putative GTP-binding protein 6 isoform X1 [Poeciliopsis prolifica]
MKTLRFVHSRLPLFLRSCHRPAVACRFLPTSRRGQSPDLPPSRSLALSASSWKNWKDLGSSSEEEDGDLLEEAEVEELFQQHVPAGIGQEQHRVFIVHPDVKWGSRKQYLTTAELMMAEAEGLVNTLDNWTVVDKIILSTKTPEKKKIFGKGNFQLLTEKIRLTPGVTAVFVNVDRLHSVSEREFEEAWGVKVFDRYSVVLHIFRCNARTKEAKLQISLAEIPLLRSRLKNDMAGLDQQGGGARYIGGSGETLYEVQQRLLKERETRIRSALEKLRKKRHLLRSQRKHREFPIVSVLGYTNCGESLETPLGKSREQRSHLFLLVFLSFFFFLPPPLICSGKTTLIKALTGDSGLQPRNQLFATLDVTVHAGQLPSHMTVLYVDTIGFLSQLPHQLIDSFSATLEDIVHSDLLVHVRDVSHPETANQKANVLNVLKNLQIPRRLLDSMIEVHNKIDLLDGYESSEPGAVLISALQQRGLDELNKAVEQEVVKSTGKQILDLRVNLSSPQLSWLYKEATVQDVQVNAEEGSAVVTVIISAAAHGRYKKLFESR